MNSSTAVIAALLLVSLFSCDRPASVSSIPKDTVAKDARQAKLNEDTVGDESALKQHVKIPAPTPQLLNKAHSATVRLGNNEFDGSGVIIRRDDKSLYILTVAHAVRERINRVEIFDGRDVPIAVLRQVKVLSQQERADLALIQVPISDEIETSVSSIAKLDEKDPQPKFAYSVGCGGGKPPTTHRERILGAGLVKINLESGSTTRYMWKTETSQEQGRSGGPLLDVNGNLLGIALGKYEENGYYAHLREISEYLIDSGLESLVTCGDSPNVGGNSGY